MSLVNRYGREHARRSIFHTIGFRAVSQVATTLNLILLVRGLSEHSYGVLQLLYSFIPVISTIASFGLEQTLRRYQPDYLRASNVMGALWLVRVVSSVRFATNVLILGVILLAWNLIAPHFGLAAYRAEFALFGILIILHFQSRILQFSLASHMLHRYSVGAMAALGVAKLLCYLPLYLLHQLTLRNAILADIAAYAAMYVLMRVAHRRQCGAVPALRSYQPEVSERKRLLRYTLFNNFNDAGSLLTFVKVDNFFIAAFLNPLAVGTYAFYTRLNQMTNGLVPARVFENVIQPLFFAVPPALVRERIPRYFTFLINSSLLVQLPLIAFALVYHAELVNVVFGGKFSKDSALLPLIVAFATTNNAIANPVTLVAQQAEKASLILMSQLFGLYQFAAMIVLIPLFGIWGAAISTGTFHLLRNGFVWWNVRNNARWLNAGAVLLSTMLIWGGVIAACYGLRRLLDPPPIVDMMLGAAVCGLGVLIYARSPGLARSDREILANVLHGRERRLLRWLGVIPSADKGRQAGV